MAMWRIQLPLFLLSLTFDRAFGLKLTTAAFPVGPWKRGEALSNVAEAAIGRDRSVVALNLAPWQQDLSVSSLAIGGTLIWLQIWISLAKNGKIDSKLSRKIIHSGSAPIFMCLWPLYSNTPEAKYFASGVVFLQALRLAAAGLRKDDIRGMESSKYKIVAKDIQPQESGGSGGSIVDAISRGGGKKEALQGPLVYTIMLFIGTFIWFRDSPAGVVGISQMAAGDGLADIVGRRFGKVKWSFAPTKSIAGTVGFIIAAIIVTTALVLLYGATGFLPMYTLEELLPKVALISVLCSAVELAPFWEDNISVPLAGAALAYFLL